MRLRDTVGGGGDHEVRLPERYEGSTWSFGQRRAMDGGVWRAHDVLGVVDGRRRTETGRRAGLSISAVGGLGQILEEVSPFWTNRAGWSLVDGTEEHAQGEVSVSPRMAGRIGRREGRRRKRQCLWRAVGTLGQRIPEEEVDSEDG